MMTVCAKLVTRTNSGKPGAWRTRVVRRTPDYVISNVRASRTIVEVPGVEPGSAEPLASASPSAAVGELSVEGTPTAGLPSTYPEFVFAPRSRIPEDAFRIAAPGPGEADTHRVDGLLLVRQPVRSCLRHLCFFPAL